MVFRGGHLSSSAAWNIILNRHSFQIPILRHLDLEETGIHSICRSILNEQFLTMDYRTVNNDENEALDGHDQVFSPFLQFEPQDDQPHHEKRIVHFEERPSLSLLVESRWSHQQDLDDFFIRIYQYHQKHGFFCIILSEILALVYVATCST